MIGLDSNVLVRYLTQDDPSQSRRATQFLEEALRSGETLYLNHAVMCEMNWVLARAYNFDRATLANAIEKVLSAAQFEFEDKSSLWQALAGFRQSSADFADCLIGVENAARDAPQHSPSTSAPLDCHSSRSPESIAMECWSGRRRADPPSFSG
jgi:predicted nucleic-acid-binding protein